MGCGADRYGQLGVDQFLHPVLQQPAEQLPAVTLTEPRQQVRNQGIIVMGHRVNTFLSEFFVVLTKGHAMAHPTGGPPTYLHHLTGRQRCASASGRTAPPSAARGLGEREEADRRCGQTGGPAALLGTRSGGAELLGGGEVCSQECRRPV